MASESMYLLVELPPGFNANQNRAAYEATINNRGRQSDPYPNNITHGRYRLDGSQFIIEGVFTANEMNKPALASLLASELGLPEAPIKAAITITKFAFNQDWEVSRSECKDFITANLSDWQTEIVV